MLVIVVTLILAIVATYIYRQGEEAERKEVAEKAIAEAGARETAERKRRDALTPEQRAAEDEAVAKIERAQERLRVEAEKAKREEADRRGAVVGWALGIRSAMREPDSLQWRKVLSNGDGSVLCMEYSARNGFGGMNVEHVLIRKGKASQESAQWNKHCAGKQFPHDMTDLAEYTARNPLRNSSM